MTDTKHTTQSAPAHAEHFARLTLYRDQSVKDRPEDRQPQGVRLNSWDDLETFLRHHEKIGGKESAGYFVPTRVLGQDRYDESCESARILYADYEPDGAAQWNWPCAYIAHTTASHLRVTEKNPKGGERWHVFLLLDSPVPGEQHDAVAAALQARCPPGTKIRCVSQPAYLPTRPTETDMIEYRRSAPEATPLRWAALPLPVVDSERQTFASTERRVSEGPFPDLTRVADKMVKLWPAQNRHDTSAALAGVLYRSPLPDDRCELFLETVLEDSGSNVTDGMNYFHDTWRTLESDGAARGVPKFIDALTFGVLFSSDEERDRHWASLPDEASFQAAYRSFVAGLLIDVLWMNLEGANGHLVADYMPATATPETVPVAQEASPAAPAATPAPFFRMKAWGEIMAPLGNVPWLCKDLDLVQGRPGIIVGKAGEGKTWTAQAVAIAVATGRPAFGQFPVRQGSVLHLDLDQGEFLTRQRYQQLARGLGVTGHVPIDIATTGHKLDNDKAYPALLEVCRGRALCVLDCLRNASREDENSSAFAQPLNMLQWVSERTGCTFLVLHHSGKGQGENDVDVLRGTSAIAGAAGAVLRVTRDDGCPARVCFLRSAGYRDRPAPFLIEMGYQGALDDPATGVQLQWRADGPRGSSGPAKAAEWDKLVQKALGLVREAPGIKRSALRDAIGGARNLAEGVIDKLVAGAPECLGERLWECKNGSAWQYYAASAEDLVRGILRGGPAARATIASETQLPPAKVKLTLEHLHAKGLVLQISELNGEPAWQLDPNHQ